MATIRQWIRRHQSRRPSFIHRPTGVVLTLFPDGHWIAVNPHLSETARSRVTLHRTPYSALVSSHAAALAYDAGFLKVEETRNPDPS